MDEQHYEYRTGRTSPNKNRNGIITVLLICVIFLAGVFSALGLLNIHLFRQAKEEAHSPLSFSQADATCPVLSEDSVYLSGMTLQELPVVYQKMYELPAGLYVCHVNTDSPAYALGILPGDVLTGFDGTAVSQTDTLQTLLDACKTGHQAELTIFRNGQHRQFTLTVDKNR